MVKFLDGPAADQVLMLKRAPLFLRVTRGPTHRDKKTGLLAHKWDALDQLDDEPTVKEDVYLYMAVDQPRFAHISMSNRKASGYYAIAQYKQVPVMPVHLLNVRYAEEWRQIVSLHLYPLCPDWFLQYNRVESKPWPAF